MSDLSDEAIRAYAANIFDLEDAREEAQTDLKDAWSHIREAHGKRFADSLKLAVKRARQDADKRAAADEVDAEAERIMAILASRAPRATRTREIIEEFDPETGEVGTVAPALADDGQQANIKATPTIHPSEAAMLPQTVTATMPVGSAPELAAVESSEPIRRMSMTPLEPREAGGLKGFGFTVRFDEPEAAMLPQTAGSETAVANSTPGSGAGTVDAGEANWPSEMTTASPANEPETIPPVADPATVVSEAGGGDSAPSLAAIPVADRSQPNPICRDPDDCGVYASWAMPCQVCKAAAAHRSAA